MPVAFSKWSRSNFAVIGGLWMPVRKLFSEFLLRIAMEGIYVRVDPYSGGSRTAQVQHDLLLRRPPVTHVECPYSFHCHGLALDILVLKRVGPLAYEYHPENKLWREWMDTQYEKVQSIASSLGLDWGYALWGEDKPHFHYSHGFSIQTIAHGVMPPDPIFTASNKTMEVRRIAARLGVEVI